MSTGKSKVIRKKKKSKKSSKKGEISEPEAEIGDNIEGVKVISLIQVFRCVYPQKILQDISKAEAGESKMSETGRSKFILFLPS